MSAHNCLRCGRLETSKIHDNRGHQGTGTTAAHAFIGGREAAILQYAAGRLELAKKSRPHARHQTADIVQWNDAIEAAQRALMAMVNPINPKELADYDRYWNANAEV